MNTNIVTILAVITAVVGAVAVNKTMSEPTVDVGSVYSVTYSHCTQWVGGAKGVSHCAKYVPATEYRVDTYTKGPLWDSNGYRVVAKPN